MTRLLRTCPPIAAIAILLAMLPGLLHAQIVINELVYDDSGASPDDREFLELYNAGSTTVDISGWDIVTSDAVGEFARDTIPGGSTIAPGGYFVIADATNVPNVDFDLGFMDIWPNANNIIELQDQSDAVVDAFAYEINKNNGVEWRTAAQLAETGPAGFWGNTVTIDSTNQSLSRYLDGRDTNVNGRDFGLIPATPGASNNLPQTGKLALPDPSTFSPGDAVGDFTGTFIGAFAVDPTSVGPDLGLGLPVNPNAVPASPGGGNVFTGWDPAGGGNSILSNSLINSYDLNVYFNTEFYDGPGSTAVPGAESTTYGIGTTLTFYNFPDPSGLVFPGSSFTANGNTGIGWLYEKEDSASLNSLKLIDFGPGGDSDPSINQDWVILEEIDMSTVASGWYRLSLDFDPATGEVTAIFNDQTFTFTTSTDLLGTFYVGYREQGIDEVTHSDKIRPPLFEEFAAAAGEDADFDDDNDVDGVDFLTWQRNYPTTDGSALPSDGDATGDGNVSEVDLAVLESQFGTTVAAASGAVPEPTALILAAWAMGLAAASRRRGLGS